MATIVKHKETSKRYCLLDAGFGVFQSSKPNMFLGNLINLPAKTPCFSLRDVGGCWVYR